MGETNGRIWSPEVTHRDASFREQKTMGLPSRSENGFPFERIMMKRIAIGKNARTIFLQGRNEKETPPKRGQDRVANIG